MVGGLTAPAAVLITLGAVTFLIGEIQAYRQTDLKRMLAYSTLAQIGEITMVIGVGTYLALAGALTHIANHAIMKTMLFFHVDPAEGLQPYIGAWAHLLAVSHDLIDTMHSHPFVADGGPEMQFNVYFPREHVYRVWVQFQRKGLVNTVQFDIPVKDLE